MGRARDLGSGKSLAGERMLQRAIAQAREGETSRIPVYVRAVDAVGQLQELVGSRTHELGDPRRQGAVIFIDGADEAGVAATADLVSSARILVHAWPNTTVLLTARPLPPVEGIEEARRMTLLSEDAATELVQSITGSPVAAWSWAPSVRDAFRRPLFALLLGSYLKRHAGGPTSVGDLISDLVERALGRTRADAAASDTLLQRLAVLTISLEGRSVPSAHVAPRDRLTPLIESRLVVEEERRIRFALPILAEWFAAHSLVAGSPAIEEILADPRRIDDWRYPMIILASSFGHDDVSRILGPLARQYPGVASIVVSAAFSRPAIGEGGIAPPSPEAGKRIREAMEAWTSGLGQLADLVAPVDASGALGTLGVVSEGDRVSTMWHVSAPSDEPSIVDATWDLADGLRLAREGWTLFRHGVISPEPGWAWPWTLHDLTERLARILQARRLPTDNEFILAAGLWRAAIAITGRGSLSRDPIPRSQIDERLTELPTDGTLHAQGRAFDLEELHEAFRRLREAGVDAIEPPLPPPDRQSGGGWVWEPYTDERLMERANAVYGQALNAYSSLVSSWFSSLAPRLRLARNLPARLVGIIRRPRGREFSDGPTIDWRLEPLAMDAENEISLRLTEEQDEDTNFDHWSEIWQTLLARIREMRPAEARWLTPIVHREVLDIFGPSAVSELAYQWLAEDLHAVAWLESSLIGRRSS